jgi:murein L,D-transpeptidase YcbB/YkuD
MRLGLACLLLVGLAAGPRPVPANEPVGAPELRRILGQSPDLRVAGKRIGTPRLRAFYRLRGFAPAWDPSDGGGERAAALVRVLSQAADHGLDPAAYHLAAVSREAGATPALGRELLLTDALLRYAQDVRIGRVRPKAVEGDWGIPAPRFDAATEAAGALTSDGLGAWLAGLPPGHRDYRRLAEALIRYRSRAAGRGAVWLAPGPVLRPGARDDRVVALRRRLAVEEDALPPDPPAAGLYDAPLEAAVRRFQARHGLAVDGLVGPLTRRALDVPLAARIRQIELNLERWRWLPRDLGPRSVMVNAAAATLALVEASGVVLASRVVVGDPGHPTPVLAAEIRALVLNPAWTIPESIVAEEILPELRRHPRYLLDHDIVVLDRLDADPHGLAVDWSGLPAGGPLPRLQQRPGPANPLGRIKFDLPNRADVFLHDTPATALFARPVRTRSHGCVRVERAVELATHLLAGQDLGDRDALERALAPGTTRWVPVAPVPVYLLYWTAFVEDGILHFRDDVYGRDRRLAAALGDAEPPVGARPAPVARAVGCGSGTPR